MKHNKHIQEQRQASIIKSIRKLVDKKAVKVYSMKN